MSRRRSGHDREIAALALPALGALVAEPLFVATDTAMVGHLGPAALGGLGIAGTVLQTAIGLLVFLAYATTPVVARRIGAGDHRGALQAGVDGLWLAAALGVALAAAGSASGPWLIDPFGPAADVAATADAYLSIAVWGLPPMLVVIAATGLFRGVRDTRTPLVVAAGGAVLNAGLNAVLIYGLDLGIEGSASGTVVTQALMAVVSLVVCGRHMRPHGVSWLPTGAGISGAALSGGWLFVRTLSLRAALVTATIVATSHGTTVLGATQIILTVFSLIALALDALAVAGQTLIGHALGASDESRARAVLRRLLELSFAGGVAIALLLAALSPVLGRVFTTDDAILEAVPAGVLVMACGLPIAALVFALDGVLIGAGDARYLAWTGLLNLAVVVPFLVLAGRADLGTVGAVVAVQLCVQVVLMTARLTTLSLRARSGRWARLGATARP